MREAHCTCINGWISGEQRFNLCLHVVVWRNDVEEVFDDAKVKVDAECISGQSYPAASHSIWKESRGTGQLIQLLSVNQSSDPLIVI